MIKFTKIVPVGTLSATTGDGMTTTSTFDTITTSTAGSKIAYDTKFPGKITITPSALDLGAEYTMSIGTAAFKDIAGNFNPVSTLTVTYNVFVTTSVSTYFPANGASTNITKQTNLILEFAAPVTGGSGNGFYLCKGWAPDNFCFPSATSLKRKLEILSNQVFHLINCNFDQSVIKLELIQAIDLSC